MAHQDTSTGPSASCDNRRARSSSDSPCPPSSRSRSITSRVPAIEDFPSAPPRRRPELEPSPLTRNRHPATPPPDPVLTAHHSTPPVTRASGIAPSSEPCVEHICLSCPADCDVICACLPRRSGYRRLISIRTSWPDLVEQVLGVLEQQLRCGCGPRTRRMRSDSPRQFEHPQLWGGLPIIGPIPDMLQTRRSTSIDGHKVLPAAVDARSGHPRAWSVFDRSTNYRPENHTSSAPASSHRYLLLAGDQGAPVLPRT